MTNTIKMEAMQFWISAVAAEAARLGRMPTASFVDAVLEEIATGRAADHLEGTSLTPAQWEQENLARLPVYTRVGKIVAAALPATF